MNPRRRRLTLLALATLAASLATGANSQSQSQSQTRYPNKTIKIVVQYQAGGMTDTLARLIAEPLSQRLGQPVVVENRVGAGGIIGTDFVAKSAPDGHTFLVTVPGPITTNMALYSKLPYDPRTDLRMVSDIALPRTVLVVHPSVQATDFKGLIAAIKAAPQKFSMGSWGPGTQPHQVQVYMDKTYGLESTHIAYKGEAPMVVDLVGGTINMAVGSVASLQQHIAAGKVRAIAVVGPARAQALPNVPTFVEQGYSDSVYTITGPISMLAPGKTPDAIVDQVGKEVAAIINQPDMARRITALGAEPMGNLPAEAAANYKNAVPVLLQLARDTGVKLD